MLWKLFCISAYLQTYTDTLLCFGELSSGSDSRSHRGYVEAYLDSAWLEREKGEEKARLFTFDSLVQTVGAVDHWSDMVVSQVQSSNAVVHLVPM